MKIIAQGQDRDTITLETEDGERTIRITTFAASSITVFDKKYRDIVVECSKKIVEVDVRKF